MKKSKLIACLVLLIAIIGVAIAFFFYTKREPWQGTWWGVQDAGINWTGDHIKNLETVTFTENDDGTINVLHKVQHGSKEVDGLLCGTGKIDGGRLVITPKNGKRELTLAYERLSKQIETPFKNEDKSYVKLQKLTEENDTEKEEIRKEIIRISQKPENKIDTTLSSAKS